MLWLIRDLPLVDPGRVIIGLVPDRAQNSTMTAEQAADF